MVDALDLNRGNGLTLTPAADQRQVDVVDDLDQDAVGDGGGAAGDVLVAQEDDGDGGDPGVESFRTGLAAGDGAAQDRQPGAGAGVGGLLPELLQELRVVASASQQAAEDVAGGRGQVAVGAARILWS